MDLDHFITIKRNVRKAHDINETGVTVEQLATLLQSIDDMKNTLRSIYDTSRESSVRLLAANTLSKYFQTRQGE